MTWLTWLSFTEIQSLSSLAVNHAVANVLPEFRWLPWEIPRIIESIWSQPVAPQYNVKNVPSFWEETAGDAKPCYNYQKKTLHMEYGKQYVWDTVKFSVKMKKFDAVSLSQRTMKQKLK